MPIQSLIYQSPKCLESCAGAGELEAGEKVILTLNGQNPLWPATLVADVTSVVNKNLAADGFAREYTFSYDDADLNGAPLIDGCDIVGDPVCYGCCDEIKDTVLVERIDANTTRHYNFDGTFEDVVTGTGGTADTDIHVIPGQSIVPDATGQAIVQVQDVDGNALAPVTFDLSSLLDNTDVSVVPGQVITPDAAGAATLLVQDADGNPLAPINFNFGAFDLNPDSFTSTNGTIANAGTADDLDLDVVISPAAGNLLENNGDGLLVNPPEELIVRGDINANDRTVTVAGFNPATMSISDVYVDHAIVNDLSADGFGYLGRRDGNVFYLSANPNNSYVGGFAIEYTLK